MLKSEWGCIRLIAGSANNASAVCRTANTFHRLQLVTSLDDLSVK
jgi:hypothetical protein